MESMMAASILLTIVYFVIIGGIIIFIYRSISIALVLKKEHNELLKIIIEKLGKSTEKNEN